MSKKYKEKLCKTEWINKVSDFSAICQKALEAKCPESWGKMAAQSFCGYFLPLYQQGVITLYLVLEFFDHMAPLLEETECKTSLCVVVPSTEPYMVGNLT